MRQALLLLLAVLGGCSAESTTCDSDTSLHTWILLTRQPGQEEVCVPILTHSPEFLGTYCLRYVRKSNDK